MYLGQMLFPLVLLLYCHLAGNEHLRPRLIPALSQTVVIPSSCLDGMRYVITTTSTSTTPTTLTTTTTTSIPPSTLKRARTRNLSGRLLFLGYAIGLQIWCTNLIVVSEVLNLSAWSAAATSLLSSARVRIGGGWR